MVILREKMRSKKEKSDEVTAALAAVTAPARATPGIVHIFDASVDPTLV
jgi:quinol monooxygenase YgiN